MRVYFPADAHSYSRPANSLAVGGILADMLIQPYYASDVAQVPE